MTTFPCVVSKTEPKNSVLLTAQTLPSSVFPGIWQGKQKGKMELKMNKTAIIALLICTVIFAQQKDTFTDSRDGKKYKYTTIGKQTWMAENLNYAGKNDDTGVCYDQKPKYCEKYGALYTQDEAIKVCPPGWHLPSDGEWETLVNFAGGEEKKLKKIGWDRSNCKYTTKETTGRGNVIETEHNDCATDEFGFSAQPGGERNRGYGKFQHIGEIGCWWSTTKGITSTAHYFYIQSKDGGISDNSGWDVIDLCSVRCVQAGTGQKSMGNQQTQAETTAAQKQTQEQQVKTFKPSFDCAKASTPTENAICSDADLAELDNRLAGAYSKASSACKKGQKEWANNRNTCSSNIQCLKNSYKSRIQELENCR